MFNVLRNLITRATVTNTISDTGTNPRAQAAWFQKAGDTVLLYPYGMGGIAPEGAELVMFRVMGQEENRVALAHLPGQRIQGLQPGESYFANLVTGTNIINRANGDMDVEIKSDLNISVTGSGNLTITNLTINGNVKINGVLEADEVVTPQVTLGSFELKENFGGHTHISGSAGNPTGPPVVS